MARRRLAARRRRSPLPVRRLLARGGRHQAAAAGVTPTLRPRAPAAEFGRAARVRRTHQPRQLGAGCTQRRREGRRERPATGRGSGRMAIHGTRTCWPGVYVRDRGIGCPPLRAGGGEVTSGTGFAQVTELWVAPKRMALIQSTRRRETAVTSETPLLICDGCVSSCIVTAFNPKEFYKIQRHSWSLHTF